MSESLPGKDSYQRFLSRHIPSQIIVIVVENKVVDFVSQLNVCQVTKLAKAVIVCSLGDCDRRRLLAVQKQEQTLGRVLRR